MMVVSVVDHRVGSMMKRNGRTLVHGLITDGVTYCCHVAMLLFICFVFLMDVAAGMSVPLPAG